MEADPPDWASPSGLMSLTRTGHRAPLPKSAVLLWSEQIFLDILKSFFFSPPEDDRVDACDFSEKVTASLVAEVPLILYR